MYIIWQEIGRRMGIQDIPETLEDLMAWSGVRNLLALRITLVDLRIEV